MMLRNSNGVEKYSHEEKAEIICEAFKSRMGISVFSEMYFNLDELIQPVMDLEALINHITHEEVNTIVKNLPSGKSPGPDGFNSNFIKKC
jgi:hypothetical protein